MSRNDITRAVLSHAECTAVHLPIEPIRQCLLLHAGIVIRQAIGTKIPTKRVRQFFLQHSRDSEALLESQILQRTFLPFPRLRVLSCATAA